MNATLIGKGILLLPVLIFQSPCYRGYECNYWAAAFPAAEELPFSPLVIGVMNATCLEASGDAGSPEGTFSPLVIGVMNATPVIFPDGLEHVPFSPLVIGVMNATPRGRGDHIRQT